ncbi:oxidoreductase, partial [Rhodanobacter sp. FW510-R12]
MTTVPAPTALPDHTGADLLERLRDATALLESVAADRQLLDRLPAEDRQRLHQAVAQLYHPDPAARRIKLKAAEKARYASKVAAEDTVLNQTGIRSLRRKPVFTTPNAFAPEGFLPHDVPPAADAAQPRESVEPKHCYVCKQKYTAIHFFYDQLCPECAAFNYAKRGELADLRGRVALLTGGRVKIGYQAGLKLLRAGAELIVTTRFPRDSAARYAEEPDFAEWGHRLQVYGLDLRHTPSVEAFCQELVATRPRLDFIINNACQTVRRPPEFYAHMMEGETAALHELPEHVRRLVGHYEGLRGAEILPSSTALASRGPELAGLTRAAELSQLPLLPEELLAQSHLFPEGRLDQDLQ